MGMSKRPLFFDLDHTLWDFETNSRLALRLGHQEMNLEGVGAEDVEAWIAAYEKANEWCWAQFRSGHLDKETLRSLRFKMAFEGLGINANQGVCEALGEHYIRTSPFQTTLIPGTIDVLRELQNRGHLMVILTNGFEEVQHIKVENSGLSPFFSGVYTSDALGVKKPNPLAFERAALKSGVSMDSGAVMIGDSIESDVEGAINAGWEAVHFDPAGDAKSGDWHTIQNLAELLELPLEL